jgi:hypothetical protein
MNELSATRIGFYPLATSSMVGQSHATAIRLHIRKRMRQGRGMGKDTSKLEKANAYAARAETWWSLLEKVWENRKVIGILVAAASAVASAIYKVFGLINDLGWAGWVLALLPAILIIGGIFGFGDWVFHLRRMRKLREIQMTGSPPISTAVSEGINLSEVAVREIVQSEASTANNQIREDLSALRSELDFLPPLREAVNLRFSELDQRVRECEQVTRQVEQNWKRERAKELAERVRTAFPKRPTAKGSMPIFYNMMGQDTFKMVGHAFPEVRQDAGVVAAEQSIRGNAKYCTISADETGIWYDENEKQEWHVLDAKLRAYLAFLQRNGA